MRETSSDLAERYRQAGHWTDRRLTDFFDAACARSPDKVAVRDERFGAFTYAELQACASRLAAALAARGIVEGDRFVIALPNWHQVPAFLLALGLLGAVGVHMPVTGREREFGGVLRVSGAKGIVVPGEFRGHDYVSMIEGIEGGFPALGTRVAVTEDACAPGWVSFDRLLREVPAGAATPDSHTSASALTSLLFTSGSSGDPKGVMHSANSLGALNTTVAPLYGLGPDDVIFMGAPLGYSAGLVHGVRLAIYLGATLVLQEAWNADRALEMMACDGATFTLTTPTLLADLLDSKAFSRHAAHLELKLIFCGGSYVPSALLRRANEALPRTLVSVLWGMTEGIGTGCRPGTARERVIATDGQPFAGTELRVLGEDGAEAAPGEQGDLVMRGPQLFLGYHERPDLDAEVFLPGGWFRTGDVATIDSEGYVKITGRRKEIIIRGGANISPAEVEAVLGGDARIRGIAVVGVPDERLGERLCACVVAAPGAEDLSLEDLCGIARCHGLDKHKWPERLEMMDALPLSPAGKLQRTALRDRVLGRLQLDDGERGSEAE